MTNKTIIAGLVALAFVAGTMMTGTMADAAKGEPNGKPFKQLQEQADVFDQEMLSMQLRVNEVEESTGDFETEMLSMQLRVNEVEESTDRADSFFDVFFETFTVDSFFDVFTELQADVDRIDGHVTVLKSHADPFFDVFYREFPDTPEQSGPDSFFDVFTELQADVDRIDGHVTVLKVQSPKGDAELQRQITELHQQIDDLEKRLAALESEPES